MWGRRFARPADVLLLEEAPDVPADREQEHDRLLGVHEDAAEVLVAFGREPPQARRVLVERVERLAREDEREAEERRRDEPGAEVRDSRGYGQASTDDRPPEDEAARDQERVL